jgi:hypothetical protein
MLLRILLIFVVAGIVTVVTSKLSNIAIKDIIILSVVIAPLAILQKSLTDLRGNFSNTGSIFFTEHSWLFKLFSLLSAIALIIGLIFYGKANGIWATLILFFVSVVVQSAFYVFLKRFARGEVVLLPISVVGLILFFTFVL